MNSTRPSAIYSTAVPGFASVCAWHNDLEPGSVPLAESWSRARSLQISHGVCPGCVGRVRAEQLAEIASTNNEKATCKKVSMQR